MTNIEQLILDLCPNGVEWKKLGEVCVVKSAPVKLDKKEYHEEGLFPIVDQGQKHIIGYTDNEDALVPADDYVIFGDHTREIKYVDFAFAQGADGVKILKAKDFLLPRFLYHALKNIQIPSRGYNRHWTIAKDLEIPIPPLEIQKKIVECLDKFSALAAELQAELQMRRKQYEYYRTQLLTPHSESNSADKSDDCNWEWKTLGEIAIIKTGVKPIEICTEGKYKYINAGTTESGYVDDTNCEGDVTTTPSRGQGGIGYVGYQDKPFWLGPLCYKIKSIDPQKVLNKYIYYYLSKNNSLILQYKSVGGVPALNAIDLKKVECCIPSIEEQTRIVAILDKFEALTTSLSDGIPAEQVAQQKRYEYYRDLLLTFPRKEV